MKTCFSSEVVLRTFSLGGGTRCDCVEIEFTWLFVVAVGYMVVCISRRCSVARRRSVQSKDFTSTLATLRVSKRSTRPVTARTANQSVYRPLKVFCYSVY